MGSSGFATLGSSSGSSSIFGGVIVRCNGKKKGNKKDLELWLRNQNL